MGEMMGRIWRIGVTAVAFAVFGLGGILLAMTVFPVLAIAAPNRDTAQKRVRDVIHRVFTLFIWFIQTIGMLDINVEGAERLKNCHGCLIVANHPTLLDVVILMALSPNIQCVVKHELWRNNFLRSVVSAAGFIRNDLAAEELLKGCSKAFKAGENILIFPEGTRTTLGSYPKLLRGFANIAILSQTDIIIVVIECQPMILTGCQPWYVVPRSRPSLTVRVYDRWGQGTLASTPHRALEARRLVKSLEAYYRDALSDGRSRG